MLHTIVRLVDTVGAGMVSHMSFWAAEIALTFQYSVPLPPFKIVEDWGSHTITWAPPVFNLSVSFQCDYIFWLKQYFIVYYEYTYIPSLAKEYMWLYFISFLALYFSWSY